MKAFFRHFEIIGLAGVFLFCYMAIMFAYDLIDSNLGSATIEILIAGTAAYFLAKYFFTKEMRMKEREENVKNQKIENDFQYYLRGVHTTSCMYAKSKESISQIELKTIATWIYKAIESHKVFRPTDMENRMILENMEKIIEKWTDGKMKLDDITLKGDMNVICVNASRVGRKYEFDLSMV